MTSAELLALLDREVTVSLLDAFAALGIGETAGRAAVKRGDAPFRVIRVGRCLRVPTVDLRTLLLNDGEAPRA